MKCKTTESSSNPFPIIAQQNPDEIHKSKRDPKQERQKRRGLWNTISQTDAGLLGIDVEEDTLVANFGLGGEADEAADVGICRPI